MSTIGVDIGGTKLSAAIFSESGEIISRRDAKIENRKGHEAGILIISETGKLLAEAKHAQTNITGIGICVPGIYNTATGRVWAPNIAGWEDYPLMDELQNSFPGINTVIDSDRTCYILGETWKGAARGSSNAIYLSIGTGIGAGIMCDGQIIRGHANIAGAIGWMALTGLYDERYKNCGCFEYHASGSGMVNKINNLYRNKENDSEEVTRRDSITDLEKMTERDRLTDLEKMTERERIAEDYRQFGTAQEIFKAFENRNQEATMILEEAVKMWGMASANLVSIFNPEVIIFGGGIFGPAQQYLTQIRQEAEKWAQPVSISQVRFEISSLAGDAGLIGAGRLTTYKKCK